MYQLKIKMAERVGFEPTVPVRVRRFSRPFRYDHFGISPFVAKTSYHKILFLSIHFLLFIFALCQNELLHLAQRQYIISIYQNIRGDFVKMSKKLMSILIALLMLFGLAACSSDKNASEPTTAIEVHGDHTHVITE